MDKAYTPGKLSHNLQLIKIRMTVGAYGWLGLASMLQMHWEIPNEYTVC